MDVTGRTEPPAGDAGGSPAADRATSGLVAVVAGWCDLPLAATDDAGRIDLIRALEVVKAAAAAAQAQLAADLDASRRQEQAAAGVPATERGRDVGAQVALARRDSPHRGARHLGLAKALVHEMPHTLAALQSGRISEWRATILVRETAVLTVEDRAAVDAEMAGDADRLRVLEQLGDRALAARVKQAAYRLDPRSVVERARRAEGERCVTVRPAPDTMAYLTALLPARDAIAAHVALGRVADRARNDGDPRGRGQLMADALVDRLTAPLRAAGPTHPAGSTDGNGETPAGGGAPGDAEASGASGGWAAAVAATTWDTAVPTGPRGTPGPGRPETAAAGDAAAPRTAHAPGSPCSPRTRRGDVAVRLVMTDRSLLDGDDEPAHLDGYGPVPAGWARALVADALDGADDVGAAGTSDGQGRSRAPGTRVFLTRLLTDPQGVLVGMESRARTAPPGLADVVRTRDGGTCRTPWCDAPVRHVDHVVPHAAGGPTSGTNLQGLCERCNYTRQAHGWRATTVLPPAPAAAPGRGPGGTTGPVRDGPGARHTVVTTTPTGHTYTSTAPALPGAGARTLPGAAASALPGPAASALPGAAASVGTTAAPGTRRPVPLPTEGWIEPLMQQQLTSAA